MCHQPPPVCSCQLNQCFHNTDLIRYPGRAEYSVAKNPFVLYNIVKNLILYDEGACQASAVPVDA